ncbi:hypothetical protein, partial [Nitratidesulfovibrio oxamicus]|uniref:hypothetical protein n=1 Tax=Nitratidesulfovibrio oxamicus TaxID=32016 RepID=UPI001E2CE9B1
CAGWPRGAGGQRVRGMKASARGAPHMCIAEKPPHGNAMITVTARECRGTLPGSALRVRTTTGEHESVRVDGG